MYTACIHRLRSADPVRILQRWENYTVSQKLSPLMFDNNVGKCGPIFAARCYA